MTKEHAYAYESGYQDGIRAARSDLDRQLVWHDYAIRALCDAMEHVAYAESYEAEFNKRIKMARNALRNAQLVKEIGND